MKSLSIALLLGACAGAPFVPCAKAAETPTPAEKPASAPEPAAAPDAVPLTFADLDARVFLFTSGAGAWRTEVTIRHDGSFRGEFSDSDAGVTADDYPRGTRYSCSFQGRFAPLRRIGPQEYAMQCRLLTQEGKEGEERIVDGVREITAGPYGFDKADEFFLYLPGRKVAGLPGAFLDWLCPLRGSELRDADVLDFYGLYNTGGEQGFDSYDADPPAGVDKRFVGSWQSGGKAAVGHGERYALYGDGTFVYAASETGVRERELFKTGTWSIADGELQLSVEARYLLPVGPMAEISFDDELVKVNEEVVKRICQPPEEETYALARTDPDAQSKREAISLDGAVFLDFSEQADLMDDYYTLGAAQE